MKKSNPIKESGYIPSFSFLTRLSWRMGGNPEKALHYWLNRKSDYEAEHIGNVLEESAFMSDEAFSNKYRVTSKSLPGEDTISYKFLKSYASSGDIDSAKFESGIRLKEDTIIDRLANGWGDFIKVINGEFTPITQKQWDDAMMLRDKIRNHWLFDQHIKGQYLYQHEINGSHEFEYNGEMVTQKYRGFSDVLRKGEIVVDMKTTGNLNQFYPQAKKALNHSQLAMYGDAEGCNEYAFFAIELKYPFSCNVFWLTEEKLEEGREIYKSMLETFYKVNTENLWDKGDDLMYPYGRDFDWDQ